MSYCIFDCTQLLTFNICNLENIENVKLMLEQFGFDVKAQNKINNNKLEYLKAWLFNYVVEILDLEFLGEFEEWKDISEPPAKIIKLVDAIERIKEDNNIEELKLIIVSSASEDKEFDNILETETGIQDLKNNLFLMSSWNFDIKLDTLILKISN